jgi:two-component system sensor histidine kinase HydH
MINVGERRWDWIGAVGGFLLGVMDTALLYFSGVEMSLAGADGVWLVGGTFTFNTTALGWLAGRLAMAGAASRRDAETIRAQGEALAVSQRNALQNEKLSALGGLAAGIAHEVRNPLGVIRASAALVQERFEPEDDAFRACDFIVDESDRLSGLIGSLLAFARPEPLSVRSAPVPPVLERAETLAAEILTSRGIQLERDVAHSLPETPMDPDLVAQLLLDLVTNAAEMLPPGGHVTLCARLEGDAVALDVADDGPGVPESDQSRIFEPFFTTKERGTGLGLAMAERIARAHGGALRLVPGRGAGPEGGGACFELRLPLTPAPIGAAA